MVVNTWLLAARVGYLIIKIFIECCGVIVQHKVIADPGKRILSLNSDIVIIRACNHPEHP